MGPCAIIMIIMIIDMFTLGTQTFLTYVHAYDKCPYLEKIFLQGSGTAVVPNSSTTIRLAALFRW